MGGSLTDETPAGQADWQAANPVVYRYRSTIAGDGSQVRKLELLPNIQVLGIARQEGPHAGHALFAYLFDEIYYPDLPTRIEHCQPSATGPGIVRPDDRLVVAVPIAEGMDLILFDGFATIPEADYTEASERVTFQALATPIRLWDKVINVTTWRNASTPTTASAYQDVSLRCLFNPDGIGNCTPIGADAHVKQADGTYRDFPIFMDPKGAGSRRWALSTAVAYILGRYNDEAYVKNPSLLELVSLLDCWEPKTPDGEIDPADTSTYSSKPIEVTDIDITGKTWPEAIQDIIYPHGFDMYYILELDRQGFPIWRLRFEKSTLWAAKSVKPLKLQAAFEIPDAVKSNAGNVRLAYDYNGIINSYNCQSKLAEYEVSVILAPLFTVSAGDASTLEAFKTSSPTFETNRNKYRLFGLDEIGAGHWDFGSNAWVTTAPDLGAIFNGATDTRQWVARARPAKGVLFSKDAQGRPRKAVLDWTYASGYSGPIPGVWDRKAGPSWNVVKGGWRLLADQCGIYLDVEDPSRFAWGDHSSAARGGVLSLIEALNDSAKRILFRLTVVLESDIRVDAVAKRRKASPTNFVILRSIDGSSRFRPQIVSRRSQFGTASEDTLIRDDIAEQLIHAEQRRFATEAPRFAGPIGIPWFTDAYSIGDRISSVEGRDWSFTVNGATAQGEGPVYPRVVGIEWNFGTEQSTTLHLSDLRVGRDNGR